MRIIQYGCMTLEGILWYGSRREAKKMVKELRKKNLAAVLATRNITWYDEVNNQHRESDKKWQT